MDKISDEISQEQTIHQEGGSISTRVKANGHSNNGGDGDASSSSSGEAVLFAQSDASEAVLPGNRLVEPPSKSSQVISLMTL